MEENKDVQVEQVNNTSPQEEQKPFKVFATEEEYRKEVQSAKSNGKFEILKEIGVKNLDEVRTRFTELEAVKNELVEASKFKDELETIKLERQSLEENLLVTKLGVREDVKDDFLVLSKAKMTSTEGISLEDAMKQTLEKYTSFKNEDSIVANKIGTEKTQKSPDRSHLMDLTKL